MGKVRTALVAASAAVAVLATGCGGSGDVEASAEDERASSSTTAAPSTTEATTTTVATTTTAPVDYGRQYLDLVAPSNCALDKVQRAYEGLSEGEYWTDADWAHLQGTIQPAIREYAEAMIAFYEGLTAAQWPEDVQPAVDDLVAELTVIAAQTYAAAEAPDLDAYIAADAAIVDQGNSAGVVRAKLGLQSNVTDENDYCAAPT